MAGLPHALARHVARYREALRVPVMRLTVSLGALVLVNALLLARMGTLPARLGAVSALVVAVGAAIVRHVVAKARFRDPRRVLRDVLGKAAPAASERVLRALSLLERDEPGTSRSLAELHVTRSVAAIPDSDVLGYARRKGNHLTIAAVVSGFLAAGSCGTNPFGVIEGANVLVARDGLAPVGFVWLAEAELESRPPDYLHKEPHRDALGEELELHRGTLVTVRGRPVHAGRRLVLTDGKAEVPFVDDGSGNVVARYPLGESVELRVAARFGDVLVEEPRKNAVTSIPDLPPTVVLAGAPRKISLTQDADSQEISVRYKAEDDHGLREVHLVLRAGVREERRVLSRLDGETRTDAGGYVLRPHDAFLKRSHVPVEVKVAAKDNDPVTGPKWGESEAFTIVPPEVGEPEELRLTALRAMRKAYVEALAYRLSHGDKGQEPFVPNDARELSSTAKALVSALTESFAGLRVPSRSEVRVRVQLRKLAEAEAKELVRPTPESRRAAIVANERVVLVVDAVLRGLAVRDAKSVARELADGADDLALGALKARQPNEGASGTTRMDAATSVVRAGGKHLATLGALGADLGEIVECALLRVDRARAAQDLVHAELAAKDLAVRLRSPDPSFGARGGAGGGASSSGEGSGEDDGSAGTDAEQAFDEAAHDLESLASDHAESMGKVDQALAKGASDDDKKALGEEAKKHAQAIRNAVTGMPSTGAGSDSWTSKGAAARELAEQMARSLEEGNAADAVASGKNAQGALEEARKLAMRGFGRSRTAEDMVDDAQKKLAPEVKWAEEKLAQLKKKAAERARGDLAKQGGEEERLADKAQDVAKKGKGALPDSALDELSKAEHAAREAAAALKQGDAERGQAAQRDAQQRLEAAKRALGSQDEDSGKGEGRGQKPADDPMPIPKADAHKGPEEFRKRVLRGLGQPGAGRQKEAVQRYAEGLLR